MKPAKWKPNMEQAWVTWAAIGFGQTIYALYVPNHASPVGLVWGIGSGIKKTGRFDVHGSFVQPWARRFGVRTKINETIHTLYDTIMTSHGSKEGGAAFIKASGYKKSKDLHCFYLRKASK